MLFRLTAVFAAVAPALLLAAVPTTITLQSSAPTAEFGHRVILTAVVSPPTANGTVTFYSGVNILETEPLVNGTAIFATTLLPAGTQSLTAYYSGDANDASSVSAALVETVKTVPSRGFTAPIFSGPTYAYQALAVGDFNGDGKPDVAIANVNPFGLAVLIGNGDGTFQEPATYLVGPANLSYVPGLDVVVGDFNGDGKPDLAVSWPGTPFVNSGISVLAGNGDGTFQPAVNTIFMGRSTSLANMAVGDFNLDGKADLVVSGESGIVTLLGKGDLTFTQTVDSGTFNGVNSGIVVGDLNGDGKPDVAINSGPVAGVEILLGNGDGTFQFLADTPLSSLPLSLAIGDFNGDGKPDLAASFYTGLAVLLGNGDGTFQAPVLYGSGLYQFNGTIEVSDINGDGKDDLVALGYKYGGSPVNVISVFLGNGDGTFQAPQNSPSEFTNGEYIWTALADFNGDGKVDLVESIEFIAVSVQLGSNQAPTSVKLTSSIPNSVYGESVTLTATLSAPVSAGTITFLDGSTSLGTVPVKNGIASLSITSLPVGSDGITAVYSGSTYELPSTSDPFVQTVAQSPTSTTLLSSPNPSSLGEAVKLVAEIAPAAATGNVTFYRGSTPLGTAQVVNGRAVFSTSTLTKGPHAISATYFGDVDYQPSVSLTLTQVVH